MLFGLGEFVSHVMLRCVVGTNQAQELALVGPVVLLDAYNDDKPFQIPECFLSRLLVVCSQQSSSRIKISCLDVRLTEDVWIIFDEFPASRGVIERQFRKFF